MSGGLVRPLSDVIALKYMNLGTQWALLSPTLGPQPQPSSLAIRRHDDPTDRKRRDSEQALSHSDSSAIRPGPCTLPGVHPGDHGGPAGGVEEKPRQLAHFLQLQAFPQVSRLCGQGHHVETDDTNTQPHGPPVAGYLPARSKRAPNRACIQKGGFVPAQAIRVPWGDHGRELP